MVCQYDSCSSCRDKCSGFRTGIMVLVSILGGAVFAAVGVLLFINGLLSGVSLAAWTALAAALVYLFVLIYKSSSENEEGIASCCIKKQLAPLFIGIFGTIFSAVLAVSSSLVAGTVYPAVLVGLVFFFFAYTIISTLFLIMCLTD